MLRSAALLVGVTSIKAMIFRPSNPKNVMWDTWLFVQPDHPTIPFYLNYLSNCDSSCGGPTGGAWDGVGAALSVDGVHFADEGVVIHKDPNAVWLGSGSVLKNTDGEYVMNFSEEYDCADKSGRMSGKGCQSIFFAKSKDLLVWERLPFTPPPANDSNVFKYGEDYELGGRWDCIATIPKPGAPGRFYGYWTASPKPTGAGAGVGETIDDTGYHWRSLPPISDGFPRGEVGSVVALNNKYFMLFGGGHLYVSDSPVTGFKQDPLNWAFHTDGDGVAFSRLWNVQPTRNGTGSSSLALGALGVDTLLLTHQWRAGNLLYMAPIKQAVLGADGSLRVSYWPGNDALKGEAIDLNGTTPAPPAPAPAPAPWRSPGLALLPCAQHAPATKGWLLPMPAPAASAAAGSPAPIRLASNSSQCVLVHAPGDTGAPQMLALSLGACGAVPPLFSAHADGTITSAVADAAAGGLSLCLDGSHAPALALAQCDGGPAQHWHGGGGGHGEWNGSGAHSQLELFAESAPPLRPAALFRFQDSENLGWNSAVGATFNLTCSGECTQVQGANERHMELSRARESFLKYDDDRTTPCGIPVGDAAYTVAAWIRPRPRDGEMQGVVGWGDWSETDGSTAFATAGDRASESFYNYWFMQDLLFRAPGINDRWNHFLCRYEPAQHNRSCFWNGELAVGGWDIQPTGHKANNGTFRIGSTHRAEFFDGALDDVAIFDVALDDAQVVQAMAGHFAEHGSGDSSVCLVDVSLPSPAPATPTPAPAPTPAAPPTFASSFFGASLDMGVGVVVEANMSCAGAGGNGTAGGLLVGALGSSATAFVWQCGAQTFEIGTFTPGGAFQPTASWDRKPGFKPGASVALRLLLRAATESTGTPTDSAMSEFYVNGIMSHPYTFAYTYTADTKLGTLATDGGGVGNVAAWRMTLPAV